MRFLVLGGTVFLSRAVAVEALRRGHDVVCAARGTSGPVPDGATLVTVDRDSGAGTFDALAGEEFDAVVDVATMDPDWVRTALTELGARAAHWTFVSSLSVYSDHGTPGQTVETARLLPPVDHKPPELTPDTYGGAKVASEQAVTELFDGPAFLVRPGLIVGDGDPTDRFGYWPARLARGGRILVPAPLDGPAQFVDVVDLAEWIVDAGERRLAGTFDAVCQPVPLSEVLAEIAKGVQAPEYELVVASAEFLEEHEVRPWSGERSLPLWAPGSEYAGFMAHDVSASLAAGLRTRPIADSAAAALEHEVALGLDRDRKAGLNAAQEAELLAALD